MITRDNFLQTIKEIVNKSNSNEYSFYEEKDGSIVLTGPDSTEITFEFSKKGKLRWFE